MMAWLCRVTNWLPYTTKFVSMPGPWEGLKILWESIIMVSKIWQNIGGDSRDRPLAPPVPTALKFVPAMLRKSSTPLQLGTLYCAQKGKRQRTHPWRDAANSNDFLLVLLHAIVNPQ